MITIHSFSLLSNHPITYILSTSAHGRSRGIPHISPLVHVIIHADMEQIVSLVPICKVILIIPPSKATAMDGPLNVLLVIFDITKDTESSSNMSGRG